MVKGSYRESSPRHKLASHLLEADADYCSVKVVEVSYRESSPRHRLASHLLEVDPLITVK